MAHCRRLAEAPELGPQLEVDRKQDRVSRPGCRSVVEDDLEADRGANVSGEKPTDRTDAYASELGGFFIGVARVNRD